MESIILILVAILIIIFVVIWYKDSKPTKQVSKSSLTKIGSARPVRSTSEDISYDIYSQGMGEYMFQCSNGEIATVNGILVDGDVIDDVSKNKTVGQIKVFFD